MNQPSPPHPAEGLPFDKIEMLSQPLTTEDGFLNEACMNELAAAIRNMPETHERMADNPEWSTPWITSDVEILSKLAHCAVELWHGAPPDLEKVLGFTKACLASGPFKGETDFGGEGRSWFMTDLSLCQINKFLWDVLGDLPQFMAWNDDEVHKDWVDVHALLRNTCVEIRNERRHRLAFDRKFEAEHGHLSE